MRRGTNGRRTRLLIVDDELLVLRALARTLQDQYEVTALSSPAEALRRLASGDAWDVILADVMIPEMNGVEFAQRAVGARPELAGRIVLMTGGTYSSTARARFEECELPVMMKPFDLAELRALLTKLGSGPPWG